MDDKGNFYAANVKKIIGDETILQDTVSVLKQIRKEIILFIARTTAMDTDITSLLFVKELKQPQAVFVEEGPTEKESYSLQ